MSGTLKNNNTKMREAEEVKANSKRKNRGMQLAGVSSLFFTQSINPWVNKKKFKF